MAKNEYTSTDISKMEELEAMRRFPGMYIGNNSVHGLHHLVFEVVDNSVDEILAKVANKITVSIKKGGSITVQDDGRGIPVEWKPEYNCSAMTLVLTKPHAGGKFKNENGESAYSTSGGLHGIGLKAVNAMSEWVEVIVWRHGLVFKQTFRDGGAHSTPVEIFDSTKEKVGEITESTTLILSKTVSEFGEKVCEALNVAGQIIPVQPDLSQHSGTRISFRPHRQWFDQNMEWPDPDKNVPWDTERLETRFAQIAFLNPGVKIEFIDQRMPKGEQDKKVFYSKDGLKDYILHLNEGKHALHKPVIFSGSSEIDVNGVRHTVETSVAFQYTANEDMESNIVAFTNGIPNPMLGIHVTAFKAAFTRCISAFAKERMKVNSDDFKNDDLFNGMTLIISIKMTNTPQFLSQTKDALNSPEVKAPISAVVSEFLNGLFNGSKISSSSLELGKLIVNQAKNAKEARDAAMKIRQTIIKKSGLEAGLNFVGKTSDIRRQNGEAIVPKKYTALYIVEGDSAGGTAKQGRDSRFHAILPLRGKPKNTAKGERLTTLLENEEIKSLITAIGAGIGQDFNLDDMRYGRVVIMSDADVDGLHIRALLETFFFRYMRPLVDAGRLYAARPPLYRVMQKKGGAFQYAYDEAERDALVKQYGGLNNVEITRYKGLGEMNAQQLRETVLRVPPTYEEHKGKRAAKPDDHDYDVFEYTTDLQVTCEDAHVASEEIQNWMGDRASYRNEYLMSHAWGDLAE
ncbi:MAG TPA: type IIA DNA topoisomerase subunit B [Anaerolineaceae bacterium]|nr:type IIA DNA topoisomerase subunit B [Anaerolineaceae bacterium]HPN53188.1 type IIA DNA topoisomerase subunit B [Anaerolineaceae bacterium]